MNARMIFVAILGFFVLCSSTLSADLNEGLISHWQFDEGSGTTAYDSAGTNDGTTYGATWTTGQIYSALSFDGVDDYVALPDNEPVWLPQYNFTLSIWVYFERDPGPPGEWILDLNWSSSANPDYDQGYAMGRNSNGQISFGMNTTTTPHQYLSTGDVLAKDTWYHVVAVRDGTTQAIYMNGEPNVSRTCSPDPIDFVGGYDDDRVNIGRLTTNIGTAFHLEGKIDEFLIYDRALSAEEIRQLSGGEVPNVIGLEITGPDEVAENFSASYIAIAHYDDDSTRDVTDSAQWFVEPEATASIEAGTLTTKDIIKDQLVTIWASYTEGDVTFEAEKAVMVFAVCPTGTALSFDGLNDYVCVPDDYSLDFGTHDLSFAFWFKTDDAALEAMLGKRSTTTGPSSRVWDGYGAHLNTSGAVFVHFMHSDSSDSDVIYVTSTASYNDGNWHHLAGVYTRSANLVLYVDGVPEGTPGDISYAEGEDIDLTQPLAIGCRVVYGRSNDHYFNGSIDEVAIYNRALSAEEIRANMYLRLAGDEPGLIGYWDFDEGEGQIVYDLSGNGNDGQLGSTPDVDESDPAWFESDAPTGRCTPYLIAIGAAKEALKHKRASLKELEAALAKEWTMYEALEQWLESGDYGDLKKGEIITAKQGTHSAVQHEEQSIDALEKGIEKLLYSLSALGYGPQPPGSNWLPNVTITRPQNGAEFNPDQTIEIEADAWDYDGSVVSVKFFANGSKIGEDNDGVGGWTTNWYEHPVGTYSLTARATDDEGAATTSAAVGIRVAEEPPPPHPPPPPPPIPPPPPRP